MPEKPEDFLSRVMEAADENGRLPMPPVADWGTFPFEGEITVRPFATELVDEPNRVGEGGVDCFVCDEGDAVALWSDANWLVTPFPKPAGLPVVVFLMPRAHHDIDDLPDDLAMELGPMLVKVEAAVRSVGNVGRVHIGRWGDGSEHLHWWFMARPVRVPQLRGSFAAIWDDIVPKTPDDIWEENLALVAGALNGTESPRG
jgi:hypothetical protein